MDDYHDRLAISTPEGVEVRLELAGPGTRIVAGVVDLALQAAVAGVGAIAVYALRRPLGEDWASVIASIGLFVMLFFYDVAWELLNDGRTPGKAMLGLRVVRDDGRRVDGASSVVRNLLRFVELPLAYAPGIVMVTLTRRHQRLGDLVGGTLVLREPRRASRSLGAPPRAAAPVAPPPAVALDTAGLSDHDRSTARAYAERYERLDPDQRAGLAQAIGAGLRQRLGAVPADLSDEALVLTVARGTSLRGEEPVAG